MLSLSGGHPAGPAFVVAVFRRGNSMAIRLFRIIRNNPYRYVDYGKDFYAGIVVNNNPGGTR